MPPWELDWVENIEDDFISAGMTESRILKIRSKMDRVTSKPFYYTERVKGTQFTNLRKVKLKDQSNTTKMAKAINKYLNDVFSISFLIWRDI